MNDAVRKKILWLKNISVLMYLAGGFGLVLGVVLSLVTQSFFWPLLLGGAGMLFNALLLDVFCDLGYKILRLDVQNEEILRRLEKQNH